ncbi:hypothetical protein AFB00_21965 [Pseudonocardia sp. HH130630-07]|nr:hypothetical protein AFB00_21965 [Pseudonocardia sp. HH130630-07]
MSGTGKSTVIDALARRGLDAVDTDHGGYIEHAALDGHGDPEPIWREDRIRALLDQARRGPLFLSGCVVDQRRFSPRFNEVVLLSAPLETVRYRVRARTTNPFGRTEPDRARIAADLRDVEPVLRAGATVEIDTRRPVHDVVVRVLALAGQ